MTSTGMVTLQSAPRDVGALMALPRGVRFRLGIQLHLFPDDDAEQAFLGLPDDQQANAVASALMNLDAGSGQAPAPMQGPSNGQAAQMPQGAPSFPMQVPQQAQPPQQMPQGMPAMPGMPQMQAPQMPPVAPPPQPAMAAPPPQQQAPQAPQQGFPPMPQMGGGMPPMPGMPQQAPPPQQMPQQAPQMGSPQGMPAMPAMAPPQAPPMQPQMPPQQMQQPVPPRQPQTVSDPNNAGSAPMMALPPGNEGLAQVLTQINTMAKHLKKSSAENLEWLQEVHDSQQSMAHALGVALRLLVSLSTQLMQTDMRGLKSLAKTVTEEELFDLLDAFAPDEEEDEESGNG